MKRLQYLKSALVGGASAMALVHPAVAKEFNIPDGDLTAALGAYMQQAGVQIAFSDDKVRGHRSQGAKGDYSETAALNQVLKGTGFTTEILPSDVISIVPQEKPKQPVEQLAQAARRAPSAAAAQSGMETVVVTAQHKSEDIQQVPIAVTALSQQQLTERQIAGGPDLVKEVPNLTFSKTNFSGYNLEIRGIGTEAVSVTTDPAVAVAFNDTPFIRNHFFEQEFFDVQDVEVLRGPQGTLFGRNATAGAVNLKSALPTDSYEAMLSADIGNYNGQRLEGMLNIPIVSDKLDIRFAGEWTKRSGYTDDTTLNTSVDGRDLWSGRMTIAWNPTSDLQTHFVWEHFSEDDDRLRSGKQLCEKDPGPTSVGGLSLLSFPAAGIPPLPGSFFTAFTQTWLSQGCLPTSLYSPSAFETPNGQTLPFVELGEFLIADRLLNTIDPYANEMQSTNLRDIESLILPHYRAKNDTLEFNASYAVTPELTLTSETGYNKDFLYSTEDFNRFDTAPGLFNPNFANSPDWHGANPLEPNGNYCDPQLGCSTSMVGEDLSEEHSWQASQELRLTSNFSGPLNFSVGANYLHYQTVEDYYVLFNLITAEEQLFNGQGPGQYSSCLSDVTPNSIYTGLQPQPIAPDPVLFAGGPGQVFELPAVLSCNEFRISGRFSGSYIDPNPMGSLNGLGHNYFLSENPYTLNSWSGFGEVYYDLTSDVKLTGGLRWNDDRKLFIDIPSQVFENGGGYPVAGVVKQGWSEWTGRFNANWSPQLDFTDQSMFYASYSHGYKGGGANPPGPAVDFTSEQSSVTHPPTFAPEHIEAFELGTKNTALDGTLTLNGDMFFYNYHGYQISQIVDRTSINLNFNATVEGAELESTWEPIPGLKFNLAGGWEDSAVDKNQRAIDLMDRTAGMPGWVVVRPFVSETSNCVLPAAAVAKILSTVGPYANILGEGLDVACDAAYGTGPVAFEYLGDDQAAFAAAGFNPNALVNGQSNNNGEGFYKNLSGNKLPNSPPFTLSTGAQYSMPVSSDWAATLRADFYWQGNTEARIFNDKPYDSIHGYTNLNLALLLDSQNGWDVMFYVKNVFDVTAITGDFLNSDDTGLTTNVFLTDPRLFGVRVTKQLDQADGFWGSDWNGYDLITGLFSDQDGGTPPLWIELGGQYATLDNARQAFLPPFLLTTPRPPFELASPARLQEGPAASLDGTAKVSFELPGTEWIFSAGIRYGKSNRNKTANQITAHPSYGTFGFYNAYQNITTRNSQSHMIADFQVGQDVGLGMFGLDGSSIVGAGIRYAQFTSENGAAIQSQPANVDGYATRHYHRFDAEFSAKRSFTGIGPSLSWDASANILPLPAAGNLAFDWGANGAVLFGRQRMQGHHQTTNIGRHYWSSTTIGRASASPGRSRQVTVPNLGGFAGLSVKYNNAKVSFGYRADEFFGAMDGGIDTHRSDNVGFFGPYANISIGIGG